MTGGSFVQLPAVSPELAAATLRDFWGIEGGLKALDGERDRNFRVTGNRDGVAGEWMFKVCNAREDPSLLDCQCEVFDRLASLDGLVFPSVPRSNRGNSRERITGEDGASYWCRLTRWVPGTLFSAVTPRKEGLLHSLGACVARIDRALDGFHHPGLERALPWDMARGPEVIAECLPAVEDAQKRALVERLAERFQARIEPRSASLRMGAIHNDANDNNIVVRLEGDDAPRVAGLIDFGDMVHGWLAADLAIACTYAMLDAPDQLAAAAAVIAGYHREMPLLPEEIDALYAMICMRLCQSVVLAATHQQADPENTYLGVSVEPTWRTMGQLTDISEAEARGLFRKACEEQEG